MVLSEDLLGQRLQAAFFGSSGASLPFRPERKIDIFQSCQCIRCQQLFPQIICEQIALEERMKDGFSSLI